MNNIDQSVENFCHSLYQNINYQANTYTRNLIDYPDLQKNFSSVKNILHSYKDEKKQTIYDQLFHASSLKENIMNMAGPDKMVPCLSMIYGTDHYVEYLYTGNAQEYRIENQIIKQEHLPVSFDTIFDIASVTKLFTSVAVMQLVEKGVLDLSAPICYYDKRFSNIKNVKLSDVFEFKISLQTKSNIVEAKNRDELEKLIFDIEETEYNQLRPYSDMNAIILSFIIENVVHMDFYNYLYQNIFLPCEMRDTTDQVDSGNLDRVSLNNLEFGQNSNGFFCNMEPPAGVVHDPKARKFKEFHLGMKGHAGLFSTISDMSKFAQALLSFSILKKGSIEQLGINQTGTFLSEGKFNQFLGCQCYSKHPVQASSEVYHLLSGCAIGSGGYTGTYFTIDVRNKVFLFAASNRCHHRITKTLNPNEIFMKINGEKIYCSQKFAWKRDLLTHAALMLCLEYRLLDTINCPVGIKYIDRA